MRRFLIVLIAFYALLAISTTPKATAQTQESTAIDNIVISCVGIDPPPSCGKDQGMFSKVLNFLTGGLPLTNTAKATLAVTVPTSFAVAGPAASSLVVNTVNFFSNIPNFLSHLWLHLLLLFGRRKKQQPWGTVRDSVSRKPLAYSAIGLYLSKSAGTEQLVEQTVADTQGRFGFLAAQGNYKVIAQKPGYVFPTQVYKDAYKGALFSVQENQTITMDLYGDPAELAIPWASRFRRFTIALGWIRLPVLIIATILSIISLIESLIPLHVIFVLLYAIMWGEELANLRRSRNTITIADTSGKPLPFTIFHLLRQVDKAPVASKVTNRDGEAYVLVPSGDYLIQVPSPQNPQGTIQEIRLPSGVVPRHTTLKIDY